MEVAFQIPDDLGEKMASDGQDLSRRALEALAAAAYRNEVLTSFEVQKLLGLADRWETDAFLKRMGAWLHYSQEDLAQDMKNLDELGV